MGNLVLSLPGLAPEYDVLYKNMVVRSEWIGRTAATANLISLGAARYRAVENRTNVPWWLIGIIHCLEGGCDFTTHLHNGDPLTARTRHEPAGRPISGAPPFTWEDSAVDALRYDEIPAAFANPAYPVITQALYALEKYNGFGYRRFHPTVYSAYLWSGSTYYTKGKYADDGKWDNDLVSEQVGAALLIQRLVNLKAVSGIDVKTIQRGLNAVGYGLKIDGLFGPLTQKAAIEYHSLLGDYIEENAHV